MFNSLTYTATHMCKSWREKRISFLLFPLIRSNYCMKPPKCSITWSPAQFHRDSNGIFTTLSTGKNSWSKKCRYFSFPDQLHFLHHSAFPSTRTWRSLSIFNLLRRNDELGRVIGGNKNRRLTFTSWL